MRWLHGSFLVLGAALFAVLIWSVGLETLWHDAARLGWALAVIVAVEGVSDILRTAAWQRCFRAERRPGVLRLWWPHLAGAAVNFVTPTATLGGEVVRGSLVPAEIPRTEAVASVVVNKLTLSLADTTVCLSGAAVVLLRAPLSDEWRHAILVAVGLLLAGVAAFFWVQRTGRLATLVGRRSLVTWMLGAERAERVGHISEEIDERIAAVHDEGGWNVFQSVILHLMGRFVGMFQLWIFLMAMGAPADITTVFTVFVVGRAIDLATFLVPASLGTQEGGFMLAISLAGIPASLGLLFSLALRIEQIVWAGIGFAAYGGMIWQGRRQVRPAEAKP
jgi:uncharacterized protein (TIRG00374 family)